MFGFGLIGFCRQPLKEINQDFRFKSVLLRKHCDCVTWAKILPWRSPFSALPTNGLELVSKLRHGKIRVTSQRGLLFSHCTFHIVQIVNNCWHPLVYGHVKRTGAFKESFWKFTEIRNSAGFRLSCPRYFE